MRPVSQSVRSSVTADLSIEQKTPSRIARNGCHCTRARPIDYGRKDCTTEHTKGTIFGLLEHLRETRFTVPKITSFVTPPFVKSLKNQADLPTESSNNARIRASWVKFQKSLSWRLSEATVLIFKCS